MHTFNYLFVTRLIRLLLLLKNCAQGIQSRGVLDTWTNVLSKVNIALSSWRASCTYSLHFHFNNSQRIMKIKKWYKIICTILYYTNHAIVQNLIWFKITIRSKHDSGSILIALIFINNLFSSIINNKKIIKLVWSTLTNESNSTILVKSVEKQKHL